MITNKIQKNEGPPENMGFKGKEFEDFIRKKEQKHYSRRFKKTQLITRTLNTSIEQGPRKKKEVNKTKLEKKHSDQNCWNFARQELRSQVPTCCQPLCSLGWS